MGKIVGLRFEAKKDISPQDVSEKMKADELRNIAEGLALTVPSGLTKKELVELIKAALPDEGEGQKEE